MVKMIAVSGKGGVGKTMVSCLLIKSLAELGIENILAIDADPDSNLAESLGERVEKTIGDIREEIFNEKAQVGVSWRDVLEYRIMEAMVETDKFDLIAMGRPEGPGCYCAINHVLREVIDIFAKNYDVVVIDTEAGLEHLSRRTTRNVDVLLIVTDATKKGITTCKRIMELSKKLDINIGKIYGIINRASEDIREIINSANEIGLEIIGIIPEDEYVREYDLHGKPLVELPKDSKAWVSVREIAEKIIGEDKRDEPT